MTAQAIELLGISHRSAPIDVLAGLALGPEQVDEFYARAAKSEALADTMVLSTCNRTEIYTVPRAGFEAGPVMQRLLQEVAGSEQFPTPDLVYRETGVGSIRHLFNVSCGLDSMVVGEAQILGQVKAAYDRSRDFRKPSVFFDSVVQGAFRAARQSRAETAIGAGSVSVAAAGVQLVGHVYSDLSKCLVVVVGAGETGSLLAEHFAKRNPREMVIVNRSLERAKGLAARVGGRSSGLDGLPDLLADAHVVASAVHAQRPIITADALPSGRGRLLAMLDLGMPNNIAPEVGDLANVLVHDIGTLSRMVDANLAKRRTEIPRVHAIINREIDRLHSRTAEHEVGPLIAALRGSVELNRSAEVAKLTKGMSPEQAQAVDRATKAVLNKIMHGPMTAIKEVAKNRTDDDRRLETIRRLFANLDED